MKKIFYILAAAIVALGTVACENEGLDNINPNINVDGDTVSFVAGINRTDLVDGTDGTATVWDADDTIVVTWNDVPYEFTNVGQEDENTFSCTAEGLSAIVNAESIKAVYSNKKDGKVDSAAGVAGALLEYEGAFGNIAFEVKNAFLKFTVADPVTLTASEGLFGGDLTELTFEEAGVHYVAVNAGVEATLEYKVGESMGKKLETTFEAKKIYNLGNLAKAIAGDSNGKYYTELATAFKLAESGATITLLEDIALEGLTEGALMKVDKNLTLNVGEHTLTATLPTATKNASIFTVTKGAEFTLVGAGNIVIENGGGSNIGNHFISNEGGIVNLDMDGGIELNVVGTPFINCIVDNNSTLGAATLNVKKGTYKQNSGNIFRSFVNHKTELATINISGGSIIGTGAKDIYIWNQKMSKTTGILNITAGTFVNVQIDNDDKTLNQVTFTAEGYKLQQNANGYYDVVEWNPVAKVGDDEYESFEAALAAAEAGSTIELLANVGDVTISQACTFTISNPNGYTFNPVAAEGFKITNSGTTYTVEQLTASVWSIIGDKTGWTDDITMYNTETANVFVAYNVTFEESTASQGDNASYNEFKIRKDKAWTTQYGAGACVKAGYKANHSLGRNTGVEENGTYDIYFNSSTKQIAVMPVGQTWSDATDPKFDDGTSSGTCAWGITGSMNGWGTNDVTMYFDGTYWYAKGVQFEQNDEFKLRENAAWGWNYGANNKQNATNIGTNGDNIKATAKCCYDVYVSKTQHKVWFKAAGQRP